MWDTDHILFRNSQREVQHFSFLRPNGLKFGMSAAGEYFVLSGFLQAGLKQPLKPGCLEQPWQISPIRAAVCILGGTSLLMNQGADCAHSIITHDRMLSTSRDSSQEQGTLTAPFLNNTKILTIQQNPSILQKGWQSISNSSPLPFCFLSS